MIRILTIVGARPQFIKAAIVSKTFREYDFIKETIVHTGQHFDLNMDKIFFDELAIPTPKYNLNINSLTHGEMTGKMIIELEKIVVKEKPDFVLVYGDTNSTLAGALAAKKMHIKVIHVEAGLRSFDMNMPEEINRILTDRISDILFCPTVIAVENLAKEGFNNFNCMIVKNGDVMFDLAVYKKTINDDSMKYVHTELPNDYVLCTIHREESTDDIQKLKSIINALNKIGEEIDIILPLHPRTKNKILANNIKLNFRSSDPVGYLEMTRLLTNCSLVITDSGGLQKEAFFFKKNCVTVRKETEWTELVKNGFNTLAGFDEHTIYNSYKSMIRKQNNFNVDLYGDGTASRRILETLRMFQ